MMKVEIILSKSAANLKLKFQSLGLAAAFPVDCKQKVSNSFQMIFDSPWFSEQTFLDLNNLQAKYEYP